MAQFVSLDDDSLLMILLMHSSVNRGKRFLSNEYTTLLSSDSILVPWVKNGNYKPSVVYKEGMIPYSPFNIEANDFMRAFYYDE